jgi:hypothetical protein
MNDGWQMNSGRLSLFLLGGLLLLTGACQTAPGGRAAADERTFAVSPQAALQEAWALLTERGYRVRMDPAAGRLEAFSPLRADAGFREAVQRRVRVAVAEEGPGQARVRMTATLLEESEIPVHGRATFERPLVDPWYFELFFEELAARLER